MLSPFQLCKAHMCSRCKTIMYPTPENSGYNHRRGFCTDGAKQVSKNEPLSPWPRPPGIFSEGKYFHLRTFLETVKQIYRQAFFDRLVKALHSSRKPSTGCCLISRQCLSRAPCSSSCTRSWRLPVRHQTHC